MERASKLSLDLISQKKTLSADITILKRKPPNEYHQMLPHYEGVYKPKQNNIDFESAREFLIKKKDYKMVATRRFGRIYNMMDCSSYIKNEYISENKELIFLWIKTY